MLGRPKAVSLGTQQKMAPPTAKENKETLDKVLKNIEALRQEFVRTVERSDERNEERWTEIMTEMKLMREKHKVERDE